MAYDFCVGKSNRIKDNPFLVGSLEQSEMPAIYKLAARSNSNFLHRVSNNYNDATHNLEELLLAQSELFELLLLNKLTLDERHVLHKLIVVVSFALWKKQPLHGVAD